MTARMHSPDEDRRCYSLAPQRDAIERLYSIIATHRRSWPLPLLPDWLDELIKYREEAVALLRDGRIRKLAEVCNASD